MQAKSVIEWYLVNHRELQPSNKDDPKVPLFGWRDKPPYEKQVLEYAAAQNRGIIWKLGPTDLVIDCDIYKAGGRDAYARLESEFGFPLAQVAPTIQTPRGGRHYYFKVPNGYHLRINHDDYGKTVDFKRFGGYVVAAGSPHPEAEGRYEIDLSSPWDRPAPIAPQWLLDKLTYDAPSSDVDCPNWDAAVLSTVLNYIRAEDYSSNEEWWPLLCAAHFATGGADDGLSVFIDWSTADPMYASAANEIAARWRSLTTSSKPTYITHHTLYHTLKQALGYVPLDIQAMADFEAIQGIAKAEAAIQPVAPAQQAVPAPAVTSPPPPAVNREAQPTPPPPAGDSITQEQYIMLAKAYCEPLSDVSKTKDVRRAIEIIAHLDHLSQIKFLKLIGRRTNFPVADLRKVLKEEHTKLYAAKHDLGKRARIEYDQAKRESGEVPEDAPPAVPPDMGNYLAEKVLSEHFACGRHLVFSEGRYWQYRKTHWVPVEKEVVSHYVHKGASQLRNEVGALASIPVSSLMDQATKIITSIVAGKGVGFFDSPKHQSILNTLNFEIWINTNTGTYELKPHSPDSRLQSVVEVKYKEGQRCPLWCDALLGMFAPLYEPAQVAAHLMELIGYSLQTYKNMPAWVLLKGNGRNGKSTILDVMTALAGKSAVSTSLVQLGNDSHVMASVEGRLLVIDDDLKKKCTLPDDILKKLSEDKQIQINPKNVKPYDIHNVATAWVASNHWPKTSDMSTGMTRRIYAFEFLRDFSVDGTEDRDLKKKILDNELPGVLNLSLLALRKLRSRGRLERPGACQAARTKWITHANQLAQFLSEQTYRELSAVPVRDLYSFYQNWCAAEGVKHAYSCNGMCAEMVNAGYKIDKIDKVKFVFGLKIRGNL